MKIIEFDENGEPKAIKGSSLPASVRGIGREQDPVKIREFSDSNPENISASGQAVPGRIKVREFGESEPNSAPPREILAEKSNTFGRARAPQSIKIVDFDKGGRSRPKPLPSRERARDMKIVETE